MKNDLIAVLIPTLVIGAITKDFTYCFLGACAGNFVGNLLISIFEGNTFE